MTNQHPARSTHTSRQPVTTATAWTAPAPTTPKAGTQAQHIAGQHQRTAEERQHPRGRTEGDSSTKAQGRHPEGRGSKARQGKNKRPALAHRASPGGHSQQEARGQPAPAHATTSQTAEPAPPRAPHQRQEEGKEGREGRGKEERPENDSIRAPPSLRPRYSQRPGAPAILPAIPAYTARGQPRREPEDRGINSAFVEYAELPLTNAAHAIPGEARQGGYFTF